MSFPLKLFMTSLAATFLFALPADAAKTRKKKDVANLEVASRTVVRHRNTNVFPPGPLYFSGVYLGDDPDPNIRFQIWRDLSGRFGGEQ